MRAQSPKGHINNKSTKEMVTVQCINKQLIIDNKNLKNKNQEQNRVDQETPNTTFFDAQPREI
jgi:hypothetical protein